jgi:hypothetical protein
MNLSIDTKLDAINQILSAIGESPVNSIENPENVDVIGALGMLERTNRKFQGRGWSFNTQAAYVMNPDYFTKKILWNSSILRLRGLRKITYVKRGDYLFDFTNSTDMFTEPVTVEAVLLADFEDLPEQARNYITAKAALDFQIRFHGDDTLTQSLEIDRKEAWEEFNKYLLEIEQPNMLERSDVLEAMGGRT